MRGQEKQILQCYWKSNEWFQHGLYLQTLSRLLCMHTLLLSRVPNRCISSWEYPILLYKLSVILTSVCPQKVDYNDLQWSKVVQYAADSNQGNQKLQHIQNYDKRLDMEKHPFILIITIQFISYIIIAACL